MNQRGFAEILLIPITVILVLTGLGILYLNTNRSSTQPIITQQETTTNNATLYFSKDVDTYKSDVNGKNTQLVSEGQILSASPDGRVLVIHKRDNYFFLTGGRKIDIGSKESFSYSWSPNSRYFLFEQADFDAEPETDPDPEDLTDEELDELSDEELMKYFFGNYEKAFENSFDRELWDTTTFVKTNIALEPGSRILEAKDDGSILYYTQDYSSTPDAINIYQLNPGGNVEHIISTNAHIISGYAASPKLNYLAYLHNNSIKILNLNGKTESTLTTFDRNAEQLFYWSPNERFLARLPGFIEPSNIEIYDVNTGSTISSINPQIIVDELSKTYSEVNIEFLRMEGFGDNQNIYAISDAYVYSPDSQNNKKPLQRTWKINIATLEVTELPELAGAYNFEITRN